MKNLLGKVLIELAWLRGIEVCVAEDENGPWVPLSNNEGDGEPEFRWHELDYECFEPVPRRLWVNVSSDGAIGRTSTEYMVIADCIRDKWKCVSFVEEDPADDDEMGDVLNGLAVLSCYGGQPLSEMTVEVGKELPEEHVALLEKMGWHHCDVHNTWSR